MRLPEQAQTRLYETYWSKIENLFRDSEKTFDAFVRDYIALRTRASKQERADEIVAERAEARLEARAEAAKAELAEVKAAAKAAKAK